MEMWKQLIVALDVPDAKQALELVDRLQGEVGIFKVGLQLFVSAGPRIVTQIRETGAEVFLDLKLHDIPNTVAHAVTASCRLGVSLLTVHIAGGRTMLEQAAGAAERVRASRPATRLLGVTVLTSLEQEELAEVGVSQTVAEAVLHRARLAAAAGLHGVVASPREVQMLRAAGLDELLIVTPGIRLPGNSTDDQARVATPRGAIQDGATHLVVGRPITRAPDPVMAAREICRDMERGKIGS